jgi:hypothetical protein
VLVARIERELAKIETFRYSSNVQNMILSYNVTVYHEGVWGARR